jgi:hypothetical protein
LRLQEPASFTQLPSVANRPTIGSFGRGKTSQFEESVAEAGHGVSLNPKRTDLFRDGCGIFAESGSSFIFAQMVKE